MRKQIVGVGGKDNRKRRKQLFPPQNEQKNKQTIQTKEIKLCKRNTWTIKNIKKQQRSKQNKWSYFPENRRHILNCIQNCCESLNCVSLRPNDGTLFNSFGATLESALAPCCQFRREAPGAKVLSTFPCLAVSVFWPISAVTQFRDNFLQIVQPLSPSSPKALKLWDAELTLPLPSPNSNTLDRNERESVRGSCQECELSRNIDCLQASALSVQ